MLHYDRIDVSESIDVNKTSAGKGCINFHYWHFIGKGFSLQPFLCYCCQDVLMMSMNLKDIAILNILGTNYFLH